MVNVMGVEVKTVEGVPIAKTSSNLVVQDARAVLYSTTLPKNTQFMVTQRQQLP